MSTGQRQRLEGSSENETLNCILEDKGFGLEEVIFFSDGDNVYPLYILAINPEKFHTAIYIDDPKYVLKWDIEEYKIYPSELPEFAKNIANITKDQTVGAFIPCLNGYCVYNHMEDSDMKFVFISIDDNIPRLDYSSLPYPMVKLSDILEGDLKHLSEVIENKFETFVNDRFKSDRNILRKISNFLENIKDRFDDNAYRKLINIENSFTNMNGDSEIRSYVAALDKLIDISDNFMRSIQDEENLEK